MKRSEGRCFWRMVTVFRIRNRCLLPGREAYEALLTTIEHKLAAGELVAEDAGIARRLAFVLTGGAPEAPGWLGEGEMHELEREAFMALVREPHTQDCIRHMLRTNRPLRHAARR